MKPLLSTALIAALTTATVCGQATLEFTKTKPGKGDVRQQTEKMRMKMKVDITLNGAPLQNMEQSQAEDEETETTILEASADAVTKVQLKFTKKESSQTGPGGEKKNPSPLVGKTYILTKKGEDITVTDAAGKPASPGDAILAKAEASNLFERNFSQSATSSPTAR